MAGFKDLDVWKNAMQLASHIYDVTETFPQKEMYILAQQMQRAAISVPSNIAEGSARKSKKEFVHFLYIAKGSLAELETQIILAQHRQYLSSAVAVSLGDSILTLHKRLRRLIQSQHHEGT